MGLFTTRWEANFEGHKITVTRHDVPFRGFNLELDGHELSRRSWSWIGLGELHGTAEIDGKHHEVHAVLDVGEGPGESLFGDGKCTIAVDGKPIEVTHIK